MKGLARIPFVRRAIRTMKKMFLRKGTVAMMALAFALLYGGGNFVIKGFSHKGSGWWSFSGYGDYSGNETDEFTAKLSEKQYKRECYVEGALLLIVGVLLLHHAVANWRERNGLEVSWKRLSEDPDRLADIQLHPENYREDMKEWLQVVGRPHSSPVPPTPQKPPL